MKKARLEVRSGPNQGRLGTISDAVDEDGDIVLEVQLDGDSKTISIPENQVKPVLPSQVGQAVYVHRGIRHDKYGKVISVEGEDICVESGDGSFQVDQDRCVVLGSKTI